MLRAMVLVVSAFFVAATCGSSPAFALSCGEFLPAIGYPGANASPYRYVHFVPKHCNRIIISGVEETIPAGVGVLTGGVVGDVLNTCVDKVCGQQLTPNTIYRTYVYCATVNPCVMKMDFSTDGHKEDPTYGNQVHVSDPGRSLVGMVRTGEEIRIHGDGNRQLTLSWFNRGHTGLVDFVNRHGNPPYRVCPSSGAWVNTGYKLEFLSFGINNEFRQAFTVPNIYVSGMIMNETVGSIAMVGIAINGVVVLNAPWVYQASQGNAYNIHDVNIGAAGADEGYIKAELMMSNGGYGGCVLMYRGALYTSPLHS